MQFTHKQLKAIELLATGNDTFEDVAKEVGIARQTLWVWRQNREFVEAVVSRARDILRAELPTMYCVAAEKAKSGQHSFFKTLLEHLDRLEELDKHSNEKSIVFKWKDDNDDTA